MSEDEAVKQAIRDIFTILAAMAKTLEELEKRISGRVMNKYGTAEEMMQELNARLDAIRKLDPRSRAREFVFLWRGYKVTIEPGAEEYYEG